MKKKIITSVMLTSIFTTGLVPGNVFANHMVNAAQQEELDLDISFALQKLGTKSALMQLSIDEILMRPNTQLIEVPALDTTQTFIKKELQEWSNDMYPKLLQLNSKAKAFVYKFNNYYPKIKDFVNNEKDKQDLLDRLNSLQTSIRSNKSKIQSHINDLTDFKLQLSKKVKNLDTAVEEGKTVLGKDGEQGRLGKEISDILKAIDNDLKTIASIPGALDGAGYEAFKEIYSQAKDIMDPLVETAMATINKGKEVEKSIEEAEKKAEKEAKEAGKSEQEIEAAKKEARENIMKNKKEVMAAAAAEKAKEYDFAKIMDPERIKKIQNTFSDVKNLSAEQKRSLNDLGTQNQKLYDATRKLKTAQLQFVAILFMQEKMKSFSDLADEELYYLNRYKKDWEQISNAINNLSENTTNRAHLKRLKDLCGQLEKQISKFNKA